MTTLVTGGTGVVGTAVVKKLVAEGRSVRALARSDDAAMTLAALGAEVARGDVLDPDALRGAADGCEIAYHIAGVVEFCSDDPSRMHRVNVDGTANLIAAARAAGVRRIVHTSSTVTLGESAGEIGSERTEHRGRFFTEYERSKFDAEQLALAAAAQGDIEVVAVNPSSVQGPGRSTGTGKIFLDAVNGRLPVMFNTPFSVVDVDDCATGHLLAEANGVSGERYVLSAFTLSAREAIGLLEDLTGRRAGVRVLPTSLLAPLGPFADLIGRAITSVPVCAESLRQIRAGARYDGSRAATDLGLQYRTARETFTRMLEWFRSEGLTDR